MLLTLLIATQVTAEWVEISQQHYRKPFKTHTSYKPFTTPYKLEFEDTTNSWIRNNESHHEHRNRDPENTDDEGVIKPNKAIKSEDRQVDDYDEFELKPYYGPTRSIIESGDDHKQKGTIQRVPNIGSVKRVELSNSPVKSPALNMKEDRDKIPTNRYEEFPLHDEQEDKKNTATKFNNRRIYVNKHTTQLTNEFPIEEEESVYTEGRYVLKKHPKPDITNRTDMKIIFLQKPAFTTEEEDEKQGSSFNKVNQSNIPAVTDKKQIFTTIPTNIIQDHVSDDEESLQQSTKQSHKIYIAKNVSNKATNSIKHQSINQVPQIGNGNYHQNTVNNNLTNDVKNKSNNRSVTAQSEDTLQNENKDTQDKNNNDKSSQENKPNNKVINMEHLLKIMRVVADTISQTSRRSFGGKIKYLHQLKDSILTNIANRIDATWPDDDATSPRRSRSTHASSRGHHVEFPSSESALMTISFLTFAVFLIKLVLQVISTYKNKAMMVAPVMVAAAGRSTLRGQV